MLDYLRWRGYLTWEVSPFCEVDALVLSWAAYYSFERLMEAGADPTGLTLARVAEEHLRLLGPFRRVDPRKRPFPIDNAEVLFSTAAETDRFGGVVIERFESVFDHASSTQFAAVSFLLGERRVIAYRGTDTTVAGWREDFHLAYRESVPSQLLAVAWANRFPDGRPTVLCGHSKGGNLAMYASLYADEALLPHLEAVYNFDGPGFCFDLTHLERYDRVKGRIHTIVPEASIIGMLLEHEEEYCVIESDRVSILQHNAFFWHIQRTQFVRTADRSLTSHAIDKTLRDWLAQLSRSEKEELVDLIFGLIEGMGVTDFRELGEDGILKVMKILRGMAVLPSGKKKMAARLLLALLRQGGGAVGGMISDVARRKDNSEEA